MVPVAQSRTEILGLETWMSQRILYIEYQPDDPGSSLRQKTRKADEVVEALLLPLIYFLHGLLFAAHQYDQYDCRLAH